MVAEDQGEPGGHGEAGGVGGGEVGAGAQRKLVEGPLVKIEVEKLGSSQSCRRGRLQVGSWKTSRQGGSKIISYG